MITKKEFLLDWNKNVEHEEAARRLKTEQVTKKMLARIDRALRAYARTSTAKSIEFHISPVDHPFTDMGIIRDTLERLGFECKSFGKALSFSIYWPA